MSQLVSIIIPTYNRAHVIAETLESISVQTYKNWECIIIDDGSEDNTKQFLNDYVTSDVRFKWFSRPKHLPKGPSACRNYGVSISSGHYIQFFDSDDIMHPRHLEMKIAAIGNNDFVICKVQSFTGIFKKEFFKDESSKAIINLENPFRAFILGEFLMCMVAPLWVKSKLKTFLPLREDLKMLIDRELHARVLHSKPAFVIVNMPLIYYRRDLNTINTRFNKDVTTGLESILKTFKTILSLGNDDEIKLYHLKKILVYFRMALAQRNIEAARLCLSFCNQQELWYSSNLKFKKIRILFFFGLFKIFKKGDTRFKFLYRV
ncbi:glycosyltransferase family 2 protein [Nonlabens sp. YIK11]|uniref:glycosyltransferase family 2 protein n=1 Tax=Nonlabens sp. YIK11 TaxID=1453349 RepID=UPI0006DBDCF2|nr:glycosyltransferase family 2 protein [Nonlabens sp. YIK11]